MHSWSDGADADEVGDPGEIRSLGAALATGEIKRSLGSTPMGARVTAQLQHDERYYEGQGATGRQREVRRNRLGNRMTLGALFGGGDDDD